MLINLQNKFIINTDDILYIDIEGKKIILKKNIMNGHFGDGCCFQSTPITLDISFLTERQILELSIKLSIKELSNK